jgi:hypothetical protein
LLPEHASRPGTITVVIIAESADNGVIFRDHHPPGLGMASTPPRFRPGRLCVPPLGQRFRLRADNGSPWFLSGAPDEYWNNDTLRDLARIHGKDFIAVDVTPLLIHPDSGQARR